MAKQNENKMNFLTTMSTMDTNAMPVKTCMVLTDKYNMDHFINPVTREETFQQLFDEVCFEKKKSLVLCPFFSSHTPFSKQFSLLILFSKVDDLNKKTERLRTFFDHRGNFLRDKYDESDYRIDRKQFNEYKAWVMDLEFNAFFQLRDA